MAATLYAWYAEHPRLGAALIRETLFLDGPFGEQHAQQVTSFVQRLSPLLEGVLCPRSAELAAQGFFSDSSGLLVRALRGAQQTGRFDLSDTLAILRAATEARVRGLEAPPRER